MSLGAYELKHDYRLFFSAIKHGYRCLIWILKDGKTDCASIMRCTRYWKAYIDRILFGSADCKSNKHGP